MRPTRVADKTAPGTTMRKTATHMLMDLELLQAEYISQSQNHH